MGKATGLRITRLFTKPGDDPLDSVAWGRRDSRITNPDGSVVFEMKDAEIPSSWSQVAADIMVSKYLRKAGLADKGYSLHCLRHTFASELLNAGMRLECLQKLLGHTSVEVTRRYARLTDKTREEEYFKAMAKIEKGEIDGHY